MRRRLVNRKPETNTSLLIFARYGMKLEKTALDRGRTDRISLTHVLDLDL